MIRVSMWRHAACMPARARHQFIDWKIIIKREIYCRMRSPFRNIQWYMTILSKIKYYKIHDHIVVVMNSDIKQTMKGPIANLHLHCKVHLHPPNLDGMLLPTTSFPDYVFMSCIQCFVLKNYVRTFHQNMFNIFIPISFV